MDLCSLFKMLSKSLIQSTIVHKIYKTVNLNTVDIRYEKQHITKHFTKWYFICRYKTNG